MCFVVIFLKDIRRKSKRRLQDLRNVRTPSTDVSVITWVKKGVTCPQISGPLGVAGAGAEV